MAELEESALRLVLVTAPDEEVGERLARALVEEGLAACVNVLPGLTSLYRWHGRVERAPEVLLLLKTRKDTVAALETRVAALHPYETPEFVVLVPDHVEARYAAWLAGACGGRAGDEGSDAG